MNNTYSELLESALALGYDSVEQMQELQQKSVQHQRAKSAAAEQIWVNMDYDATTDTLNPAAWKGIHTGSHSEADKINYAIGRALEQSGLETPKWPSVVFTSLKEPSSGALVIKHSISIA